MRNPHGYLTISGPDGVEENDTATCNHCNGLVRVPPNQRAADVGGVCKQCMGFVCQACYARVGCVPFEEKLKRVEARGEALRSYGLAG